MVKNLVVAVAAAAAGLLLAVSCGGGPRNLCVEKEVLCDAPLLCDPVDGVCKCGGRGGVICAEGQVCDAVANTCLSTRCSGVTCAGGTLCDLTDGKCKCGGTGGVICETGQVCLPTSRTCAPAVDCSQKACPLNQTCEASTGLCKCGAVVCAPGRTCSIGEGNEKTCVDDACYGVTCVGASVCDPSDGMCKCNGAACQSGEACDCPDGGTCEATERACRPSNACVGVSCVGDTTCDPADGKCKCGGPGGPVCGPDQICSLTTRQCQGGQQCTAPDGGVKSCPGGLSCDPEDGKCKCGGRDGVECQPGTATEPAEICVLHVNQRACKRPCDPRSPACPTATYCYFDGTAVTPAAYCSAPTDTKAEGVLCTSPTACFKQNPPPAASFSLHCAGLATGSNGVCRAYCDLAAGGVCPATTVQTCTQIVSAPAGYGYCQPN